MSVRTCSKCGIEKDVDQFSIKKQVKIDGRRSACKLCCSSENKIYTTNNRDKEKKRHSKYYIENIDNIKEYHRNYSEEKKASLKIYAKNYNSSPVRKKANREAVARQRAKFPEKTIARNAVNSALKSGEITQGMCAECGSTKNIQAHHECYSRPLDIMWLCRPCHYNLHKKRNRQNEN